MLGCRMWLLRMFKWRRCRRLRQERMKHFLCITTKVEQRKSLVKGKSPFWSRLPFDKCLARLWGLITNFFQFVSAASLLSSSFLVYPPPPPSQLPLYVSSPANVAAANYEGSFLISTVRRRWMFHSLWSLLGHLYTILNHPQAARSGGETAPSGHVLQIFSRITHGTRRSDMIGKLNNYLMPVPAYETDPLSQLAILCCNYVNTRAACMLPPPASESNLSGTSTSESVCV